MISGLAEGPARCFEAVRRCAHSLTDAGFLSPSWTELASSQEVVCAEDPGAPRTQGGLAAESHPVSSAEVFGRTALDGAHGRRKGVDALPAGEPLASAVFTTMPTNPMTRIEARPFRILLCRRLRLPLHARADVAACSTFMAIIVQRAPRQGFGKAGVSS